MSREKSLRREKRPLANQLTLAAGLCVALFVGASYAAAQDKATAAATVTIFSNLGPSSTDLFFTGQSVVSALNGLCIIGPEEPPDGRCAGERETEKWLAMPFTPKQNSHATMLEAAIGLFAGTNQFELGLFTDEKGVPGTSLATVTVTDAPPSGTCCDLVTAKLGTPGVALTANTQYWVVAMTDNVNAPDFQGIWAFTNFGFVAAFGPSRLTGQTAWGLSQYGGALAGAVRGTVP